MEEHEVHRAGRRHAEPGQRGAVFDAAGLLDAGRAVEVRRVPEAVERAGDHGQARVAGPPGDLGDGVAVVQADLVDAAEGTAGSFSTSQTQAAQWTPSR